ncbi:MAG: transposase [Chloroflexota bacterium]|nr:transposase [Chloroflexota bacterium]
MPGTGETEYEEIKGVMWIVRKNNEDLTSDERKKLNRLFEYSSELKSAYTFREELMAIFEMQLTKEEAKRRLLKWVDKVRRSALTCFDVFLTTLSNWLGEIVNYFANRLNSGFACARHWRGRLEQQGQNDQAALLWHLSNYNSISTPIP